jgi:hypothetical protein
MVGEAERSIILQNKMRYLSGRAHDAIYEEARTPADIVMVLIELHDPYWVEQLDYLPHLQNSVSQFRVNDRRRFCYLQLPFSVCQDIAELDEGEDEAAELMEMPIKGHVRCVLMAAGGLTIKDIEPIRDVVH